MITAGLYAIELIPFMGNELVCKLTIYRWNGDGWSFKSLEAVFFKDAEAKETYINKLIKEYNHEV
jgi:hypothetical protein